MLDTLGFLAGLAIGYFIISTLYDDDDLDPPSRPNAGNRAADEFLSRFAGATT